MTGDDQRNLSAPPLGIPELADFNPADDAWHDLVRMPDDDTQTLRDVLAAIEPRQRAFVKWLAEDWYATKAELQALEFAVKAQVLGG